MKTRKPPTFSVTPSREKKKNTTSTASGPTEQHPCTPPNTHNPDMDHTKRKEYPPNELPCRFENNPQISKTHTTDWGAQKIEKNQQEKDNKDNFLKVID